MKILRKDREIEVNGNKKNDVVILNLFQNLTSFFYHTDGVINTRQEPLPSFSI